MDGVRPDRQLRSDLSHLLNENKVIISGDLNLATLECAVNCAVTLLHNIHSKLNDLGRHMSIIQFSYGWLITWVWV